MKALVISGGGNKSAFSIGALKYLLGDLETKYDIICGTSSGAIVAALIGMYKHGQEKEAARFLEKWWSKLDNAQIYRRWKFWGSIAALWKPSMLDSSPLQHLIRSNLNLDKIRASGKIVSAGAVSLNSGKYLTFDQSHPEFINSVIGSSSYPGMFLPVSFKSGVNGDQEELWSDGGVKTYAPVQTSIDYGATEIDIIYTSPEQRDYLHIDRPGIVSILKRSFDASLEKIMSNDLSKLELYNELAKAGIGSKKYIPYNVIRPLHNLTANSLDFDPDDMKRMIVLGYNKAKEVMENNKQI